MATRFLAPSMGEGIHELTIVNWLKKEDDAVQELEGIVEVETDKVTAEIPSPVAGTILKILAQKDDRVTVGSTLAWIGQPGEIPDPDAPTVTTAAPSAAAGPADRAPASATEMPAYAGRVSPLVKKLVAENQIDLNLVPGTGLGGRITKEDVLNYLAVRQAAPAKNAAPTLEIAIEPGARPIEKSAPMIGELLPHTAMRRKIAERMVSSKHIAPHVLAVMEADLSRVVAHRAAHKAAYAAQGVNLTLTAYFCAAVIAGLQACPEVNASWLEAGIQRHRAIHLGIATALGAEGLIVPVIKNADRLSLSGLAHQINDLAARARAKKLLPEEVQGGTFTLTNHGTGGSLFAAPIIFQPQAAILGVGMLQKRVVVVSDASGNDAMAIRPMVYLSLVFDHRILDGEGGDRFLTAVKARLEKWD